MAARTLDAHLAVSAEMNSLVVGKVSKLEWLKTTVETLTSANEKGFGKISKLNSKEAAVVSKIKQRGQKPEEELASLEQKLRV